MLKSTRELDGKFLTMVCCQEMLVQQEEKMSTSTVKKKDQKEAEKMIPLKIASRGLFEAVWFIFQCCVFIAQVDMARAVAASFFFFFLWLCSVRGREELVYTQHLHTIRETLTVQMGGKKFSPVSRLVYEKHHYRAQNSLRDVLGSLAPEAILSPSPGYVR